MDMSKWRHHTKAANRERHEDLLDCRFRQAVLVMSDKELKECRDLVTTRLALTPKRHIYVRDRLETNAGVMLGEILRRARQASDI